MMYCSKCGSKIEVSDGFCPNCGVKVNQTSNENHSKEKMDQTFEHVKSVASQVNFTEIINFFKLSVLSPVSGGEQFVTLAKKTSVIIIAIILTSLQGLLGIWRVNQIISSLSTIITNVYRDISSLAVLLGQTASSYNTDSSSMGSINRTIDQFKYLNTIPYGKIFIGNCGLYLALLLVLFISVYIGISIFTKVKCTPFLVFKGILISTLPILLCEIISIVFSYFSVYLGIIFIVLGVFISITTLAIILKDSMQIKANLCVLIISISSVIALTAFFITYTYYLADVIKAIAYKYYILINQS